MLKVLIFHRIIPEICEVEGQDTIVFTFFNGMLVLLQSVKRRLVTSNEYALAAYAAEITQRTPELVYVRGIIDHGLTFYKYQPVLVTSNDVNLVFWISLGIIKLAVKPNRPYFWYLRNLLRYLQFKPARVEQNVIQVFTFKFHGVPSVDPLFFQRDVCPVLILNILYR